MNKKIRKLCIFLLIFIFSMIIINTESFANVKVGNKDVNSLGNIDGEPYSFYQLLRDEADNGYTDFFNATVSELKKGVIEDYRTVESCYTSCWHVSDFDQNSTTRKIQNVIDINKGEYGTIYVDGKKLEDTENRNIAKQAELLETWVDQYIDGMKTNYGGLVTSGGSSYVSDNFKIVIKASMYGKYPEISNHFFQTGTPIEQNGYYMSYTNTKCKEQYQIRMIVVNGVSGGGQPYVVLARKRFSGRAKTGNLKIVKTDSTKSERLKGAKFAIIRNKTNKKITVTGSSGDYKYNNEDNNGDVLETNDDGEINVKNLPVGEYTLKEIQAPVGYKVEGSGKVTVSVSEKNNDVIVPNEENNGNLKIEKVDKDTGKKINNISFKIKCKTSESDDNHSGKYLNYKDGKVTYSTKAQEFTTGKDGETGQIYIEGVDSGTYIAIETSVGNNPSKDEVPHKVNDVNAIESSNAYYTVDPTPHEFSVKPGDRGVVSITITNKKAYGSLGLKKVDANNDKIGIEGATYDFYCVKSDLSYWTTDENGVKTYHKSPQEGNTYSFTTRKNGAINIAGLESGSWTIKETDIGWGKTPYNEYYALDTETHGVRIDAGEATILSLKEKQDAIDLSGKVWENTIIGKRSERTANYNSKSDILMANIKVVFKKSDGTIARKKENGKNKGQGAPCETVTGPNGEYKFEDVYLEDLDGGYVEFEYDGLTWQNITPQSAYFYIKNDNEKNVSKASEGNTNSHTVDRQQFNNAFETIENTTYVANIKGEKVQIDYDEGNGVAKYKNGVKVDELKGTPKAENVATLDYNTNFPINSTTENAGYNLYNDYDKNYKTANADVKYEIKNINLGLYRREQPNLELEKDVYQAKISVNNTSYVYDYDKNLAQDDVKKIEDNIAPVGTLDTEYGVQFKKEKGKKRYKLPIYRADRAYTNNDETKMMKAYITYKIALTNLATTVHTRVNGLVDYYDSRYKVDKVAVSNKYNANVDELEPISYKDSKESKETEAIDGEGNRIDFKYKVLKLEDLNINIKPICEADETESNAKYVYITFEIPREELKYSTEFNNYAEITSYSSFADKGFDESRRYAGIDTDSRPNNIDLSNYKADKENDTDIAPGLGVVMPEDRQMFGTVFEDHTSGEISPGNTRNGDGIFKEEDNEDKRIGGVEVTLRANDKDSNYPKVYHTTTVKEAGTYKVTYSAPKRESIDDPNYENLEVHETELEPTNEKANGNDILELKAGDFVIMGYIPGTEYTVDYTWGIEKGGKSVQNYKATIYKNKDRQDDKKWYTDISERHSDALDDYDTRKIIDNDEYDNPDKDKEDFLYADGSSNLQNKEMVSTTPVMDIQFEDKDFNAEDFKSAEYDSNNPYGYLYNKYQYKIEKVDFGIAERARQKLDIFKRISNIKLYDAYGTELINAEFTLDDDGKPHLSGSTQHLTYMAPSMSTLPSNGYAKIELDNEIMQGATLKITYTITVANNGEKDYDSEDYYNYGIVDENKLITTKAKVYDYLSSNMALDQSQNDGWKIVTRENYNPNIDEEKDKEKNDKTRLEKFFYEKYSNKDYDYYWLYAKEDDDLANNYQVTSSYFNNYFSGSVWFYNENNTECYFNTWNKDKENTLTKQKLNNRTIVEYAGDDEQFKNPLGPGESASIYLHTSQILSSNIDEINFDNQAEITEVEYYNNKDINKESEVKRLITPLTSIFYAHGEKTIITPPTGGNNDYIILIITIATSLVILCSGVILIKKKVLK